MYHHHSNLPSLASNHFWLIALLLSLSLSLSLFFTFYHLFYSINFMCIYVIHFPASLTNHTLAYLPMCAFPHIHAPNSLLHAMISFLLFYFALIHIILCRTSIYAAQSVVKIEYASSSNWALRTRSNLIIKQLWWPVSTNAPMLRSSLSLLCRSVLTVPYIVFDRQRMW